jgi:serine/threonine protein kinase
VKLGMAGVGCFYRGFFHDRGLHVAIKRVTCAQGIKVNISEMSVLSQLRHPNLVQFIGWSDEVDKELLLVYELLMNGLPRDPSVQFQQHPSMVN